MTAKLSPQQILDQKYTLSHGQTLMSGSQALVRLPMLQKENDRRAGLNTGGFISGYRGSPLSGFDQQLWRAEKYLKEHDVVFQPGLNEDLAATAVWGTQQVNLSDKAQFDGVFSMWYGKGPGVDRSIDAIKHANMAGASQHGGVLMVAGDDHAAKSSTTAHQSDHVMAAAGVPVLYPSNVQEFLDFGLHGWAMSRYSGLWVGLKCVTQVVETTSTVEIDPERQRILLPEDFDMPEGGLNLRWPDMPLPQEERLVNHKWYAALAYIRANRLNRVVIDSPQARFGIMAAGKAYQDVRQALSDLGLDRDKLQQLGVRVMKVGCVWPLDGQDARQFAEGLDEVLVVEEKRQMLEYALKEALYNWRDDVRPKVYGKFDARGDAGGEWSVPRADWLLPSAHELSSSLVAKAIAKRLVTMQLPEDIRRHIEQRIAIIEQKEQEAAKPKVTGERTPWFCSGCPHNSSTKVPEGSRALAGIGCHFMVLWMDRDTATYSHMGGEGAAWIGQSPFIDEDHVFVNMGDGTYFHSGLLAIRASIGAQVNATYKILFNDAIAMTGGQPVDGQLTVSRLAHQMAAEGAARTVIVTDNTAQYDTARLAQLPAGVDVYHRDELDDVQRSLRETAGTTILIYEQMCGTEKRRRRKRGTLPTVDKHVFINDAVCEGCGDCSKASNCLSVEPLETAFGTKRKINHSTCNQDFSCVKGFCPSFVTVEGAELKTNEGNKFGLPSPLVGVKAGDGGADSSTSAVSENVPASPPHPQPFPHEEGRGQIDLPAPNLPTLNDDPCRILITGVGGTGVITVGALLGMAAYLDGLASSALDMTGLAQKGGAVLSHVQLANQHAQIHSSRIALAGADVLLGCDGIVSASTEALSRTLAGRTKAVVNSNATPTAAFVMNRDWTFPGASVVQDVQHALGEGSEFMDANELALQLLGSTLYANAMIIGYAWQKGWLPLQEASLLKAMEVNGVKVAENQQAFQWGRYFAHHGEGDDAGGLIQPKKTESTVQFMKPAAGSAGQTGNSEAVSEVIARYSQHLTDYQNKAYAQRYREALKPLQAREQALLNAGTDANADLPLTRIAAVQLGKLMAYKDEYEVARLYSQPEFMDKLREQFAGEPGVDYRIKLNLAPPMLSKKNAQGHLVKKEYGQWVLKLMPVLAKMKRLRGTALDVFGKTAERQQERRVAERYSELIAQVAAELSADNQQAMQERLMLADSVRGFGHVKMAAMDAFEQACAESG